MTIGFVMLSLVSVGQAALREVGTCGDLRVLEARRASSALDLLAQWEAETPEQASPIILVRRPFSPHTSEDEWPTPPGNLYLAWASADPAPLLSVESAIVAWITAVAPELPARVIGEPGEYGGVYLGDRLIAGVAVLPGSTGTRIGVDVHTDATARGYRRWGAGHRHVSMRMATGRRWSSARWGLLSVLLGTECRPGGAQSGAADSSIR